MQRPWGRSAEEQEAGMAEPGEGRGVGSHDMVGQCTGRARTSVSTLSCAEAGSELSFTRTSQHVVAGPLETSLGQQPRDGGGGSGGRVPSGS